MTVAKEIQSPTPRFVWGLGLWLAGASVLAISGAVRAMPPPMFPLFILGPVVAISMAYRWSSDFQRAASTWRLEPAIALHVLRAPIGLAFLFEMEAGRLHPTFATLAGYGDIIAGAGALLLLAMPRMLDARANHRWLWGWNALALLDIVAVVITAQRIMIFGEGPSAMPAFFELPYPFIPFVVVPLVILTHLWIFARIRAITSRDR